MSSARSANALPEPSPPTPWGLVILLGSLTAMGPLAIDMYLSSLPTIGRSLQASPAAIQATMAAFLAGMAIGQVIYGPLTDRIGRRPPILFGAGLFMAASVGCALATSVDQLLVGRFIQALGACSGAVVSRATIRDRFDHTETARVLSLMMLIMGLAPILAPLLGTLLLGLGGWRSNFWFMAVYGGAIAVAAFFRLKESRTEATAIQASQENPLQAYWALMCNRRLMGFVLGGALNGATLFTYISTSPGLVMGTYGISTAAFPVIFGLNALGLVASGQINRLVLRRLTPEQVLSRANVAALVVGVLLALAAATGFGERWSILLLIFLLLSSYGFMQGNTMAGALNCDPIRAGSISALSGAMSFSLGAVASSLTGLFHDGTPRPMAFGMLICILGASVALRGLALKRDDK